MTPESIKALAEKEGQLYAKEMVKGNNPVPGQSDFSLSNTYAVSFEDGFEKGAMLVVEENKLVQALRDAIKMQVFKYETAKADADWYNNNMPGVGQTLDYKTYESLPKWVEDVQFILASLELKPPASETDKATCSHCGDEIEIPLCRACEIQLTLPTDEY